MRIVMALAALPVLALFGSLYEKPKIPAPASAPYRARFVSERTPEVLDAWTDTERDQWFEQRRQDLENGLWISKVHDDAEAYRAAPACGGALNPCHVTVDR
jgi:predicted HAD superfamily Cof-like phosphohydrolase